MKKLLLYRSGLRLLLCLIAFIGFGSAVAQTNHVVISQIYGGGGNSGAPYNRDFVELFNPTGSAVSLTGWSIQYASTSGTTWNSNAALTGSIGPGKYYLVRMTLSGTTGAALPTADYSVSTAVDMSGTNGKVALCSSTVALSGSCPTGGSIVDFVGFGTANCFEGTSAAPAGSNSAAIMRNGNGCVDTNVNSANFTSVAPSPRNSASPAVYCFPTKLAITAISPVSPTAGNVFDVTVQSWDAGNNLNNVIANTNINLTTNGNGGIISGTTSGTITAGTNSVTISGVILASAGSGVTITASRTAGDILQSATSSTFIVQEGSLPEIAVEGNSTSIADGNATTSLTDDTDFGTIAVAGGTVSHIFSIQNTGTAALTIGAITFSGANADEFSVSLAPASSVAAGDSTTFAVTFDPSNSGVRTASISIANNDSDENPFDFSIQGTGSADTAVMDYVNLQSPSTATILENNSVTVYAQGYEPGVTEAAGPGTDVAAWIGYSSVNSDPSGAEWTWIPATYNVNVGNNDEFQASLGTGLAPGTYYYASRWQIGTGPYAYGGTAGNWTATSQNGVLTVNADVVDYANVQFPATATITVGGSTTVYAQVYEPGITEAAGQGAGITAWIGYSNADTDPGAGDWTWVPATFNIQQGNNDEYMGNIGSSLSAGTYYYASRFQKDGSSVFSYGGLGGFWNNDSGVLTVNTVQEINVQGDSTDIASGDTTPSATDGTDFGAIAVGQTVVRTFTIQNTGGTNLVLSPAVTLSESDAFSITQQPASPVAPGGSSSFEVTFNPSATGADSNTVLIASNDGDEASYSFDITGLGSLGTPHTTDATDVTSGSFIATWDALPGATGYRLDVSTSPAFQPAQQMSDLIISEYIEGSSNNKAIEIFNGTGATVNLTGYSLKKQTNGANSFGSEVTLSGSLANGAVYIVANSSADQEILDLADDTNANLNTFNGNDAVALYKDGVQIDVVGIVNQVANWGNDVTLVRKSTVLSPTVSYSINDWNSFASDTFTNLGAHAFNSAPSSFVPGYENLAVTGTSHLVDGPEIMPGTTYYYRVRGESGAETSADSTPVISVTTLAEPPTFGSIALAETTVCDGSMATINVSGLLPDATSVLTYNIDNQSFQTIDVDADEIGFGTFSLMMSTAQNGLVLTVTSVDKADDPGHSIVVTENNTVTFAVAANVTYYADNDGDGFGDASAAQTTCTGAPAGYVLDNTDCNDAEVLYTDADGDGFGSDIFAACTGVANTDDCDDSAVMYADADADGYGSSVMVACGGIAVSGDCNDDNSAVHPNATEIGYNLIDDDCDGSVDEGFPPKNSAIMSGQCNTTLAAIDSQIIAGLIAGAQGYQWRVTTMSGSSVGQVQFLNTSLRVMKLTQLANYAFDTTYKIEVAVYYAGFLQPYFSSNCTVTTPVVATSLINCSQTLGMMTDVIYAHLVPFATGYMFRITDPAVPSNTQELARGLREFRMNLITAFQPQFNKQYNVEIAVRNTNGEYLPYGPACTITTPLFPTSYLQDSQCDDYAPATLNTPIYALSYPGAIGYVFNLSGNGLPAEGIEVTRSTRAFKLSDFASLIGGATYNVRVRLIFNVNDVAGPYGKVCSVIVPAPARVAQQAFDAVAYPNPFADNFSINVVTSAQQSVNVKVYDMTGRLLENTTADVSKLSTLSVGDRFPSGVYNVIVSQGDEVKTLRVVKR